MLHYNHIISALTSDCWAIKPEKMEVILEVLDRKVLGFEADESKIEAAKRRSTSFKNVRGDIGIVPIYGTITQRPSMFTSGGTSTTAIRDMLTLALNVPSIGAVILDVDSPGGSVFGVTELASFIRESLGK